MELEAVSKFSEHLVYRIRYELHNESIFAFVEIE